MSLLQRKEKRGFDLLYDSYSPALYGVILKIVRSEELSEDVMQDAFVKIWRNVSAYDKSKGSLFTWILNVARNTAIDKIRSQEFKKTASSQPIDGNLSAVDRQSSTQMSVEHIGLAQVVNQLKPEHQIIIDFIYFKGFTQVEVAETLNIPLGTVKTRVKAAMNHLRELIV